MRTHENPRRPIKILENPWNTMNVIESQETNLESSKCFCRGSRSHLTVLKHYDTNSTKKYRTRSSCHRVLERSGGSLQIFCSQKHLVKVKTPKRYHRFARPDDWIDLQNQIIESDLNMSWLKITKEIRPQTLGPISTDWLASWLTGWLLAVGWLLTG